MGRFETLWRSCDVIEMGTEQIKVQIRIKILQQVDDKNNCPPKDITHPPL